MFKDLVYTNSAINARRAKYELTRAKILALVRAKNFIATTKILAECDFQIESTDTIDTIIEREREKTFNTVMEYCPDVAIKSCVLAVHKCRTTKLKNNETLSHAEETLETEIKNNIAKIGHTTIRDFFQIYLDSFSNHKKINENDLWTTAEKLATDFESVGMLFHWYISKQIELVAVRIILSGQMFGLGRERILTDLGDIYDRFK